MEEEVIKEISLKVEVMMEMFNAMEDSTQDLNNTEVHKHQLNLFKQKQSDIKDQVKAKFKEYR
jgi:hypothetical protein